MTFELLLSRTARGGGRLRCDGLALTDNPGSSETR